MQRIVDALLDPSRITLDSDTFLQDVSRLLAVQVRNIEPFPNLPNVSPELRAAQSAAFEQSNAIEAAKRRKRNEEDLRINRHLAAMMSMAIEPQTIDGELREVATGQIFDPITDGTLTLELIERYKLNVIHGIDGARVEYETPDSSGSLFSVYVREASGSISRAICMAAVRCARKYGHNI